MDPLLFLGIGAGIIALLANKKTTTVTPIDTDVDDPTDTTQPTEPVQVDPRQSPYYIGKDKSLPYDRFHDCSDILTQVRLDNFDSAKLGSMLRMRILPGLFVCRWNPQTYIVKRRPNTLDFKSNAYGFRFRLQIFNPTRVNVKVTKIDITKIFYYNQELLQWFNFARSGNNEVGMDVPFKLKPISVAINYDIAAKSTDVFDIFLDIKDRLDITTSYLHTANFNAISPIATNGMFAIESQVYVNNNLSTPYQQLFGLYYGNEPAATVEEFWTRQYIGENPTMLNPVQDNIENLWNNAKQANGVS